jgi:autotransporter passenger strand-loop-strand repeat protein
MSRTIIGSGQTSSVLIVGSGDRLEVMSGGTVSAITVDAGGTLTVDGGGSVFDLVLSNAGTGFAFATIESGGSATDTTVSATDLGYAIFNVDAGGTATSTTVTATSGGYAIFNVVGTADGNFIGTSGSFYAAFNVSQGATTADTELGSGGRESLVLPPDEWTDPPVVGSNLSVTVPAGATVTSAYIDGGMLVLSQDDIADATVVDTGLFLVWAGTAEGTILEHGGFLIVGSGATADNTTVQGGVLVLDPGSVASGIVLGGYGGAGAFEQINSTTTTGTTIADGGTESVGSGGEAFSSTVADGGLEILIDPTAIALGTVIESGGTQGVASGASAVSTTVSSGGLQIVASGGVASDTVLSAGGTIDLLYLPYAGSGIAELDPATDILTITQAGETTTLQLAGDYTGETFSLMQDSSWLTDADLLLGVQGAASGTDITVGPASSGTGAGQGSAAQSSAGSGGGGTYGPGAGNTGGRVSSGAGFASTIYVSAGQTSSGLTIGNNEALVVQSGGTVSAITVDVGGWLTVEAGGTAIGTVLSAATSGFANASIQSGGSAADTTVAAAAPDAYAELDVDAGGSVTGTTVSAVTSSFAILTLRGTADGTTVQGDGAFFNVDPGAIATNTEIGSGGGEFIVLGSGQASGLPVIDDSIMVSAQSGAMVISAVVAGGSLQIQGGATAEATLLESGFLTVAGAVDDTVVQGGFLILSSAAEASFTVLSGSAAYGETYGTTTGTTVSGGAWEQVFAGGEAIGSTISDHGSEDLMSSTASALDTVIESGGMQSIAAGATATSATVSSGGLQVVSPGGSAIDTLLEAGGTVDLTGAGGGYLAEDPEPGVLTVMDGGTTVTVQAGDPSLSFSLTPDGNGGTEITLGGGNTSTSVAGGLGQDGAGGFQGAAGGFSYSSILSSLSADSSTQSALQSLISGGTQFVQSSAVVPATLTTSGGTTAAAASYPGLVVADTTTGDAMPAAGESYSGPVAGLANEYIDITADNLNVAVTTDSWFIHTGAGDDAIAAFGGTNVLDGGTGSNFLTGGSGTATFFVDDRSASADIWSTINGFHAGDAATVWGVTQSGFSFNWVDGQGAAGYTGLTLHVTAAGQPTASLTLVGFSQADLGGGRISVQFGTDAASSSAYMYILDQG